MGHLKLAALTLLLAAGCGSRLPTVTGAQQVQGGAVAPVVKKGLYLQGKVQRSDGTLLDLAVAPTRPRLLVFSQDSCSVCQGEARSLVSRVNELGHLPANMEIVTVLVGAELDDAADWVDYLKTTWTVAIDSPDHVMNSYCTPHDVFPCSVIETPDYGIVFQHTGRVEIADYETITGAWK